VLVVSHDRYFLDRICDQIVAFEDGDIHFQLGNYSAYLDKRKERTQQAKALAAALDKPTSAATPAPAPAVEKPAVKARKLSFKEQRELEGMEDLIFEKEAKASELEKTLNDPKFYATRAAEAASVTAELEAVKVEITRLYARWEELESPAK
jgi:ATP-binding cassette subfamily F protein uup